EKEVIESIEKFRENSLFLPEVVLSENLYPVSGLENEVEKSDILIFAVPSKFIRKSFESLKGKLSGKTIISLSKGFESTSLKTISRIASDVLGKDILNNWITISGPSFAKELSRNFPTAIVAASENPDILRNIQEKFSSSVLRIYRSNDLIGIEVAGSMKNIMAIASGIINGLGYGFNTTASLVTRASMEILKIGLKLGANRETFWGLAGIGDLMLTSFGPLSRNFQLGVRIAKGETLKEIEKKSITIAEGVETTKAIRSLSRELDIEMPISDKVYEILFEDKDPASALKELMQRSLKIEWNLD
ncbi:MAG: NAD(P)-dependent glycerol-3-phosphate dehydrogenase, partial [Candidatus Aminicenantes bacterium]|nr:NAD(P)-dependent glycerol-3-phosphate dehydrogenase [Candidatus Aminicenantes bacterium]